MLPVLKDLSSLWANTSQCEQCQKQCKVSSTWWLFSNNEGRMNSAPQAYPPNGNSCIRDTPGGFVYRTLEVDVDQVNPQEVLAEDPAQHLLWLLAKHLHLPTAGVQGRLTLVNIFFFPCSSLWLSPSLFNTFSDCPNNGLCCFDGCSDRCLESSQQGRIKELLSNFLLFAKAQNKSIQTIFSAAPEAASAPVVAVEEASEPKGYNYPVPGTHTYFIQKLDHKIL